MTQTPFDPFALWRDMFSKWDTGFGEMAGKIAPPEFMAVLMGRYLTAMNMPTRTDLAALDVRLQRIEDHLARLAAQLEPVPGKLPGGVQAWRIARQACRERAGASFE